MGTLNTRTLRTEEREIELENALKEIKYSIIGLSEVRKIGENIIEKTNGDILYYVGKTKGQKGVGFLVHKRYKHQIKEFIGISERIALLRMEVSNKQTTIIQIYAPTEASTDEEIESFYRELDDTINKYKSQKMFVIGDFNSKVGEKKEEEKHLGPYGIGIRNKRGDRLVQFAQEQDLYILNTFFKKPLSAKWTWKSPDGRTKNEIDFILSNYKKDIKDIQVLNGLRFDTDHRMVRARIKTNKRKIYVKNSHRIKTQKVNSEIFETTLQDKLQNLDIELENNVQKLYNCLQSSILESAEEASKKDLKIKNRHKLSSDTVRLIEQREMIKKAVHESIEDGAEYTEINRRTKRAIRKDIREYNLNKTREILENSRSTKKVAKEREKGKMWMLGTKDKQNQSTRSRVEIVNAATSFYKQLYDSNKTKWKKGVQNKEREEELPDILKDEVEEAINFLKSNKAPGEDGIINEYLKWGKKELITPITNLFNKILMTEKIPQQWQTSTIILLHKKGNRDDLNNYRPISLMPNMYKLFTKILTNRITKIMDENQPPEQAGFRKQYSTIDHLHTINQVIEKTQEFNLSTFIAFIDYKKAFDSVEHASLVESLEKIAIHPKYIRLIDKIYTNCYAKVKTEIEGETFQIKKGVRQGDPMSPKIFTCILEMIFRKLNWNKKRYGININGKRLSNLRFADDIVLFAKSESELRKMMEELTDKSKEVGLEMNTSKTKIMSTKIGTQIIINGTQIQNCKEYTYLGQTVSLEDKSGQEI